MRYQLSTAARAFKAQAIAALPGLPPVGGARLSQEPEVFCLAQLREPGLAQVIPATRVRRHA
jgi:hypothetical protein